MWSTYIIFISLECTGVIWALLLSPTRKVQRSDGSKIVEPNKITWKQEFRTLWRAMHNKLVSPSPKSPVNQPYTDCL